MPRGSRPGERRGGRQRGTPNKISGALREQLAAYCQAHGVDPHRFMVDLMRDEMADLALRFAAAKELAQYLQPKLRAVDHRGDVEHTVRVIEHRYGRPGRDR